MDEANIAITGVQFIPSIVEAGQKYTIEVTIADIEYGLLVGDNECMADPDGNILLI